MSALLQLDLFAPVAEAIVIQPTRDVVYRGAFAPAVPVHTFAPRPRPRAMPTDADWLGVLLEAERCIRWRSWQRPHPLPIDKRPEECVGGGPRFWHDSKGVGLGVHHRDGLATWPVLLRGLAEQRKHEPDVADARDLAAAYHALEQYDRFYVHDGGSVIGGGDQVEWRERVAVPHLAKLRAIVEKLGGDPDVVLAREAVAA